MIERVTASPVSIRVRIVFYGFWRIKAGINPVSNLTSIFS